MNKNNLGNEGILILNEWLKKGQLTLNLDRLKSRIKINAIMSDDGINSFGKSLDSEVQYETNSSRAKSLTSCNLTKLLATDQSQSSLRSAVSSF